MSKMFKETPHFQKAGRWRPSCPICRGPDPCQLYFTTCALIKLVEPLLPMGDAGGDNHRVAGFDNAFLSG